MSARLYYFHDPMCSWCWAFTPVWHEIRAALPTSIATQRVLGGLAPDSDAPMPAAMQEKLEGTWRRIQEVVPGTRFNFDFWKRCAPRRSTYPACRAVIAARLQDPGRQEAMIAAIQHAYYLEARNPSEIDTLVALAGELGLDPARFSAAIGSPAVQQQFAQELETTRRMGVQGFPSLILQSQGVLKNIRVDYLSSDAVLKQVGGLD